ncbi:MAG: MFS transporter [Promethearchaeota archaeon]|nr:MAG: MFS transporter [Candidatus Lokiarchaeota archaeon]
MSENNSNNYNNLIRTRAYFAYLIVVLILVEILDTYATVIVGAFPSKIAEEFLSQYSENEQNAIMALGASIASVGAYLIFFNQYLSDKFGRKIMLVITVLGMATASLLMILSTNYFQYVIFVFLLNFFQLSDIWLIYINEEAKKDKRAFYTNILLIGGLTGAVIMVILRSIFITDTVSNWRAMLWFPIILGFPLALLIALTIKETKQYEIMKQEGKLREKKGKSFRQEVKEVFQTSNKKAYTAILVMSFIYGSSLVYLQLFEKYIADVGTLSQSQVTLIFVWSILAVFIAYGLNALLLDKIGRKPLLYVWAVLMPISVITWVLGALTQQAFILVQIGYALTHVCYWGLLGVFRISTLELIPTEKRGTALGLRSLCNALGTTATLLLSSMMILFMGLGNTFIIFALTFVILIPLNYLYGVETKGIELSEIK